MRWIEQDLLNLLRRQAEHSPRKRQHLNLHHDYSDPAQRLLNHVLLDSYIRPHRHLSAGCDETLFALTGLFAAIKFDDEGRPAEIGRFGSESYARDQGCSLAVIIEPTSWHTVIPLTQDAVLLECKAGPFDPNAAKDMPSWAPEEGSDVAAEYLAGLRNLVEMRA